MSHSKFSVFGRMLGNLQKMRIECKGSLSAALTTGSLIQDIRSPNVPDLIARLLIYDLRSVHRKILMSPLIIILLSIQMKRLILDPAVWFKSHNPLPTIDEGGNVVKVRLVCNSMNPRALSSHPVLFVQLRAIYNEQTFSVADTPDFVDATKWINNWLNRNLNGRLILMINGQNTIGNVTEKKYKSILSQCASLFPNYPIYYVVLPDSWLAVKEHLTPGIIAWWRRHRLDLFNEESCYVHRTKQHEDLAEAAFLKRRSYKFIDNVVRGDGPPGWLIDCDVIPGMNPSDDSKQSVPLITTCAVHGKEQLPIFEEASNGLFIHGLHLNNNDLDSASKKLAVPAAVSQVDDGTTLASRGQVKRDRRFQSGIAQSKNGSYMGTRSTTATKPFLSSPPMVSARRSPPVLPVEGNSVRRSGLPISDTSIPNAKLPSQVTTTEGMRAVLSSYCIRPKVSTKTATSVGNASGRGAKRKNRAAVLESPKSPKTKRTAAASKPTAQVGTSTLQTSIRKISAYDLWRPSQSDIRSCALAYLQQKSDLSRKYKPARQINDTGPIRVGDDTTVNPVAPANTPHKGQVSACFDISARTRDLTSTAPESSARIKIRSKDTTGQRFEKNSGIARSTHTVAPMGVRRSADQSAVRGVDIIRANSAPGSKVKMAIQKDPRRSSCTVNMTLNQAMLEVRKAQQKIKQAELKAKILAKRKAYDRANSQS
ncbi:hypothetical protein SARC_08456 [Sphaeroforma arctica JP610]|uniref:Uncharacterized protein n=1 Tax=Sphaeroforma arctica JP610 TaxID=667725 RepID=A0A0L0FQU9_9EUKA|nr:hypothetical protein SARC_08456 [Sphaeroforma arctica JP610]KNC79140.1 hypothetical protein SARC_08456 [Sphaeroforma arctica JP610]|eukprot:XP_014153042.1 hypothetical protein SARC_08456 [Sphaeroforma arctica JP610]